MTSANSHQAVVVAAANIVVFLAAFVSAQEASSPGNRESGKRTTISLDGTWEIAEGKLESVPEAFSHKVPVPGLIDLAKPEFQDVGVRKNSPTHRDAFWYRKSFRIPGEVPARATLKIRKAKYGIKAFLNGVCLGESDSCFFPATFDLKPALKGNNAGNELVIRVGATPDLIPKQIPYGHCGEKQRYIPGIYDSVEVILSGGPYVDHVQVAPLVDENKIRVLAKMRNSGEATGRDVSLKIYEKKTGKLVSEATRRISLPENAAAEVDAMVELPNCQQWTPESPFLYRLVVDTGADASETTFGMREFRFDPKRNQAILNGEPCYLRGTTIAFFRFMEDTRRADLPWDREWVRRVFLRMKEMNWNFVRSHIGYFPEFWYEIADETGMLIQDEYPIWGLFYPPKEERLSAAVTVESLAGEYTAWILDRCNHPSVVLWSSQNETMFPGIGLTGQAVEKVRHLDLSDRPWNNGWGKPIRASDPVEVHFYGHPLPMIATRMQDLEGTLKKGQIDRGTNWRDCSYGVSHLDPEEVHATTLTEYGWMWLNRDGTPARITKEVYKSLLGEKTSPDLHFRTYATHMAALTEYFRASRRFAGICYYGMLNFDHNHSTAGDLIDLRKLEFYPYFEEYMKNAWSPVGCAIDFWLTKAEPHARELDIYLINDTHHDWQGKITTKLFRDGKVVSEEQRRSGVKALGREVVTLKIDIPRVEGKLELRATLTDTNGFVTESRREFEVKL